jgi:uncharacterized FlgJ-related protein
MDYKKIVYDTAISEGASPAFAKIIVAQLQHESADFKSNVFKKNNNANGMKVPSRRKSPFIAGKGTQPPGNEGKTPYARFNSLQDNVRDLFHWLKYNKVPFKSITTVSAYAEELRKRSYMGNTEAGKKIYIAGLSRYLKKIADDITKGPTPGEAAGGMAVIGIIIFSLLFFLK